MCVKEKNNQILEIINQFGLTPYYYTCSMWTPSLCQHIQ